MDSVRRCTQPGWRSSNYPVPVLSEAEFTAGLMVECQERLSASPEAKQLILFISPAALN